ncbi:MAG: hypothetical protein HYW25_01935 [Candidatus Aenigmarchaeota archaeon]|nr:hypothetical protein [Candidatus Aenigmarchaeota archaeon]
MVGCGDIAYRITFDLEGVSFANERMDSLQALRVTGELDRLGIAYKLERGHIGASMYFASGKTITRDDIARDI